ncbi:hypothetical protein CNMCM8980_006418 [Aspergillus fumigatiaffinis]|uniref:F-box domain-containing protein n=1 Tax=Aspergillus fumigatiaffinis TaxID=340414 RepID=A0A8H4M5G2_9EURO|nr:hypothetical protein CNMCM5878_006532 [Aspergillus fumigatiaffinis]KAF4224566.1 hypothetical protein CNMCM6457_009338 [Aspergillus fumigatiaffinis]KAF4228956.1 hypothetical protein CNMCM6805_001811 [Aspergillus fumigatiaffinis]KAF4248129.1 hypothetical protein CNMCM8980_006418 [Aspergillus fumigatiaffinis]
MLLDLPPELIQLVLQSSTTPSFLQVALSCRALHEIASSSREVILHHLHRTPGLKVDTRSLKTRQLFQLLMKRSFQQLYGAQFSAKCTTFCFEQFALDARASSLASHGDRDIALVLKGRQDVYVFQAKDGKLHLKAQLRSSEDQTGMIEVLKTAFDREGGVNVLHRLVPAIDEDGFGATHPFVRHAIRSGPRGSVYMARHSLQTLNEPIRMCAFPDHVEYEPLALAAAGESTFAISWQHFRESDDYEVVLYNSPKQSSSNTPGVIDCNYNAITLIDGNTQRQSSNRYRQEGLSSPYDNGPAIDISFNDRSSQLLYYHRAQTLYGSFQRIQSINSHPLVDPQPTLYQNACMVQFSDTLSLLFSIAIPFFGTHARRNEDNIEMCHWRYLAFGIATHRKENWTVACLLKSEARCQAQNCGHILNLDRGRRFSQWTIVARLWGFQNPTNSLGCKIAASDRGTRLAVANWNVIYVWALEPNALIEENANGFYPTSFRSTSSGVIELRPIVLPLDAVCFKLGFTHQEDELIAITDRGLMYWDLGPLGKGQRITQRLTF